MGEGDAAVLEEAYEGGGERIAALERERDRLRGALEHIRDWDRRGGPPVADIARRALNA